MKKCSRCKIEKDLKSFGNNKKSKDRLWCYCKSCVSELGKKERQENPEKFREICKKTYEKHKERKKAEQREYYWKNHNEVKERANKRSQTPEFREQRRKYYAENKEWIKKQHQAHQLVQYAIKLGILKKYLYCEECGLTDLIIDGHHENYDEPLKVKWVCRKCHRKLEK